MSTARGPVTRALAEVTAGKAKSSERLLPLVYEELRRLAHARLSGESGVVTLPATALVHEAYLRLLDDDETRWEHRGHFFAVAAEAMRRITIEYARAARRLKRGGNHRRVTLEEMPASPGAPTPDVLDLDRVLEQLEAEDALMAQVVKLRYFAGLTVPETARAVGLSPRTVNRLWTAARAWLNRALSSP